MVRVRSHTRNLNGETITVSAHNRNIDKKQESLKEEIEEYYRKYEDETNMSCSELKRWKKNPLSKKASIGREAINRNIRLQCKNKGEWGKKELKDAKKAYSYLNRAKEIEGDNYVTEKLTKNDIALKNWAYDPNK